MHTLVLRMVTILALGQFVLYELFPRLTAGLRGCMYYTDSVKQPSPSYSYVPYPVAVDVSRLSKEINATLKWNRTKREAK